MKALVVKLSSLGDVVHTLPALTDAQRALPGIRFDWVVEEALAEIPQWHPAVDRVIPIALRRGRRKPLHYLRSAEWRQTRRALAAEAYDVVIDAQGLLKSACVARMAIGPRAGLDRRSAREPLASWTYHRRLPVAPQQHAIERTRLLFAQALKYALPDTLGEAGVVLPRSSASSLLPKRSVVFCHATARPEKSWPVEHWALLARQVAEKGVTVLLPSGSADELAQAQDIVANSGSDAVFALPRTSLHEIASLINAAAAVVSVDTGLGHLAAALSIPGVALYGPTRPALVGTYGNDQHHLCAEHGTVMNSIDVASVWRVLEGLLPTKDVSASPAEVAS